VIKKQRASGLSAAEFCRRNDVSGALFYRWRRKLAELDAKADSRRADTVPPRPGDRDAQAQFVPIELPPPSPSAAFEIVRPDGCRVLIRAGFEAADLRELLRVLEDVSSC
jgi:transposase-like protein